MDLEFKTDLKIMIEIKTILNIWRKMGNHWKGQVETLGMRRDLYGYCQVQEIKVNKWAWRGLKLFYYSRCYVSPPPTVYVKRSEDNFTKSVLLFFHRFWRPNPIKYETYSNITPITTHTNELKSLVKDTNVYLFIIFFALCLVWDSLSLTTQ